MGKRGENITMYFQTMSEFWAMGGHGLYVWLAYGISIIILAYNATIPIVQRRQLRQQVNRSNNRAHAS